MRTCIVGLGQRAAGDDAVGLAVIDSLKELALPEGVEIRVAPDASELVELFGVVDRLILVDAAVDGAVPGTVRVIDESALDSSAPSAVSSHGMGGGQALALARALHPEARPDVRIVAVSTARPSRYGVGLSPEVAAAVPRAVSAVIGQMGGT